MAIQKRSAAEEDTSLASRFNPVGMLHIPKNRLAERAMLAQTAYQIVVDEVMLDGNARFKPSGFHH